MLPIRSIIQLATDPKMPHIEKEEVKLQDAVALLCTEDEARTLLLVFYYYLLLPQIHLETNEYFFSFVE